MALALHHSPPPPKKREREKELDNHSWGKCAASVHNMGVKTQKTTIRKYLLWKPVDKDTQT